MNWVYLVIAGILETFWAICLKQSEGFTKLYPSILTAVGMIFSFYFLSLSLKALPLGTAYAIWTGIGTIGTLIIGIVFFHEPYNAQRIICASLIIFGIIGLKLVSP